MTTLDPKDRRKDALAKKVDKLAGYKEARESKGLSRLEQFEVRVQYFFFMSCLGLGFRLGFRLRSSLTETLLVERTSSTL
jgi:hypothetical protein